MSILRSPLEQNSGFTFPDSSGPSNSSADAIKKDTNNNNNISATSVKETFQIQQPSSYFASPESINHVSHSKFKHSRIGTIDENLMDTSNQFEKSFANLSLKKVSSRDTVNSESTLVESLHNKNDSLNSINSIDTLNSFRLKRFNSASSVPSFNAITNFGSPEITHHSTFPLLNSSPNGSLCSSASSSSASSSNSTFQLKKVAKFPIPSTISTMTNTELSLILEGMTSDEDNSILILDVRPYIDYNTKHIKNAINFNLPSTLLKRSNFTLTRCLSNLSIIENVKINKFLSDEEASDKKIIIYDDSSVTNNEISLAAYGTSNKFLNDQNFKGEIYVLKNGLINFNEEFPGLTEASSNSNGNANNHSTGHQPIKPPHNRSLSLANISSSTPISPNLSRFQLPKLPKTPVFKIRHNEEFYDFDNYKIINEFKFLNSTINRPDENIEKPLPKWLKTVLDKNNYLSLFEKFKNLEIEEKKRINNLVATNNVTSGIELGFKNRYKDIFPYEHSRVKLSLTPTQEHQGYINANFINCPQLTKLRYIATQAPLSETTKDFTKLCEDNDISLIISLTNQFENGIEKCFPYWDDSENFEILERTNLNDFVLRRLRLTKYNKEVLQIQILNWSDFDIMVENQQVDVLKLIYLKKTILDHLQKQDQNVIVHCSAGCGRTGTFCTLDSIINTKFDFSDMNNNNNKSLIDFDPIFEIVENFRVQRISMVQNLRQYLFIYDCLLNYYENFKDFRNDMFGELDNLNILKNYLSEVK